MSIATRWQYVCIKSCPAILFARLLHKPAVRFFKPKCARADFFVRTGLSANRSFINAGVSYTLKSFITGTEDGNWKQVVPFLIFQQVYTFHTLLTMQAGIIIGNRRHTIHNPIKKLFDQEVTTADAKSELCVHTEFLFNENALRKRARKLSIEPYFLLFS